MIKFNFADIAKKNFYIIATVAIAAIFAVAYFNDRKTPPGSGEARDLPVESTLPTSVENANNIGTTEGDGKFAPLFETEIGQPAAIVPAAPITPNINTSPSTGKVCLGGKCYIAELAITPQEHERGLMFRSGLGNDRGMLFDFGSAGIHKFWMKNTLISLDIVWIGADKKIIFISNNISPCIRDVCPSYGPDAPARYVLEVNGGQMKSLGAKIGDTVEIKQ